MKQILLFSALIFTSVAFAQNEKYVKAMEATLTAFDTTRNVEGVKEVANKFHRIADAEKTQWLPYYYAALANLNMGFAQVQKGGSDVVTQTDALADKTEQLISKADELNPNNSEIYLLKKMLGTLRLMVDPQSRYMTYGPAAAQALATAKQLNPENPRVYLMEAQDKFYTPEFLGGSKTEAAKIAETAMQKFTSFKPESSLHPKWGKQMIEQLMQQAKK